jgi:polygalacturonase
MLWNRRSFLATAALAAPALAMRREGANPQQPSAAAPQVRALRLSVRDFGARGDGTTKDTAAIQRTIDRCAVLGGGEIVVPDGRYLTGALALRANTLLRLETDAVLQGSADFADYPVTQVRWEGKWIDGHIGLIHAIDAQHVGIAGSGRIEGNPEVGGRPNAQSPLRHPALIEFIRCAGVHCEGFSTSYSLMWSIHPTDCEDAIFRGLTIRSTGGNGDGIDVDSCRRVWIDSCDISTGDDCIALKSGRGAEAWALRHPTEDVRITNCTLADSIFACIGIGSESSGGIRGVRIEHCRFTHAKSHAIYIKSRTGRAAFIEDISAADLDVSGTEAGFLRINVLSSGLQDQSPVPGVEGIPAVRNFRFSNIRVKDCPVLVEAVGIHPDKPLQGLSLRHITGTCKKGIALANATGVDIRDIAVTGYDGPLVSVHNVKGSGLKGAQTIDGPKLPAPVPAAAEPYRLK